MIKSVLCWLKTKKTPKQISRLYSKLVCLDLDSPVRLESCVLNTHGLTLELLQEGRCFYVTEAIDGKGLAVSQASLKNDLVVYKQIANDKECCDYTWARLMVDVDKELTERNYYSKRQKELLASMVNEL